MTYSEKLKDPRWQKKRLEILTRDKFQCQACGNERETLHVHHNFYEKGLDPWEYPDESMVVLCESCHSDEHDEQKESELNLIMSLRSKGMINEDLNSMSCLFMNLDLGVCKFEFFCMLGNLLSDPKRQKSFVKKMIKQSSKNH